MKIVSAKEMMRIEQLAYAAGASEESFMNEAGRGVAELAQWCVGQMHLKPHIMLLCGAGNNAADTYVAGTILREGGFDVSALALVPVDKSSPLCQAKRKRFKQRGGIIHQIEHADQIDFGEACLLVDGILGTGFHGTVEGLFRAAIEKANASHIPILAVDIPSGLNGTTGEIGGVAIHATHTLFLGLPKTGCFLGEAWNDTGHVHTFDFGLAERFVAQASEDFFLIEEERIHALLPPIHRTRHKYMAGYVVGLGGSPGMPGAPLLASFAALRTGAGIVRLLHPAGMEAELAAAPYELIRQGYHEAATVLEAMERASAIFVGPGIGTSQSALNVLHKVLQKVNKPCVIDADALTLLAEHPTPFPPQTILTPHVGEMKRLLGLETTPETPKLLELCQAFCEKHTLTLVLKGAPTFIFHPNMKPHVSPVGDPGMATAGSGDVLTGIIAGFLAQTKNPLHAALLGVYFHGVAGEYAAADHTSYSMIASDITAMLPRVFLNTTLQT